MKSPFRMLIAIVILFNFSYCSSYNSIMTKNLKESLGRNFKSYSSFSYPTDNFGVLTSYSGQFKPENQLCAMSSCIKSLNLLSSQDSLTFKGLLDVGEGGEISLSQREETTVAFDAVLPQIWQVLSVNGGFRKEGIQTVNLSFSKGYVRFINKIELQNQINSLPDDDPFKIDYVNNDLIIIVSDVLVTDLNVRVQVDNSTSTQLDAALDGAVIGTKEDINLAVSFTKLSEGVYTFTVRKPVIVLRLPKKQPTGGGLGSSENFDDWIDVKDFIENEKL